ncbi:tetratricopeptide repeat protein [Fredinandcohnia sp. 179-A 10B2 NHS]|uniref:tetratricopeptide repeat protein n=1 Tax=Fredinandcohnia sp. 179-A 10B2 NHS TaxID=3235176 RepID=UPI0039A09780
MIRKIIFITSSLMLGIILCTFGGIYWLKNQKVETLLSWKHEEYIEEKGSFYTIHYHPDEREKVEKFIEITPKILELGDLWFKEQDLSTQHLNIYLIHKDDQPHPGLSGEGIFTENNIILLRSKDDISFLLNTYSHEFAHFFIHLASNGNEHIPDWFHEGVASAFAQRISPITLNYNSGSGSDVMPFAEIKREEDNYNSSYIFMQYAVEYLIYKHEKQVLMSLIQKTKETGEFSRSFNELTGLDLKNYHNLFSEDWEPITKIQTLITNGEIEEAEQSALTYLEEKGHYFYEAPHVYNLLTEIYLTQNRFEDALLMLENNIEFQDIPMLYQRLAEIALHSNQDKALTYAEEAVNSATRGDWNIDEFKRWLREFKEKI